MSSSTSQRRRFVGANWKCNGTVKSVQALVEILNGSPVPASVDVVVGVPALHAGLVKSTLHSDYQIALQNCYVKSGAFTGEHSVDMIADFGISWVIIGHSERRHIFRETDEEIADKVAAALKANLKVIFCIGELLEERQALQTLKVCERQLKAVAAQVSDWSNIVIAYEPVWAIGTGHTATPAQAQEVHADLRNWLATNVSAEVASTIRIIYGGSVNGANSAELFTQPDIDGFLVGGASLKPEFLTIISNASK